MHGDIDNVVPLNSLLEAKEFFSKQKYEISTKILYSTIIELNEEIKDRKIIEKIILCDTQKEIYPNLEKIFISLLSSAGFPGIKFEK